MVAQDIMSIGRGISGGAFETVFEKRYDGEAAREHDEGCVGTIVCTELGRERTMVAPLWTPHVCVEVSGARMSCGRVFTN